MHVKHDSPERLTVSHGAGMALAIGLLFVVGGGWMSYAAHRDPASSTDGLRMVFAALLVAGLWMLWGAQPSRHRFDARTIRVALHWRRLLGLSRRELIAFDQIVAVDVDGSPMSDDDRMWRVSLVLRDARRIPLTPYWLSSRSASEEAATAIRALLASARARVHIRSPHA